MSELFSGVFFLQVVPASKHADRQMPSGADISNRLPESQVQGLSRNMLFAQSPLIVRFVANSRMSIITLSLGLSGRTPRGFPRT